MPDSVNVLVIEDSKEDADLMVRELNKAGLDTNHRRVETAEEFLEALRNQPWHAVLADYTLPRFSAMRAFSLLTQSHHEIPFIVVTGSINEETAVDCLKQGVDDYILKENLSRLGPAVRQGLQTYQDRRERRRLEEQLRYSQKMETLGTLAGGIAHDFNNLLTAIIGFLDMARAALPEDSPCRQNLAMVDLAAGQAVGITRALLTFSRRTPSEKRAIRAEKVCAESSLMLHRLIPAGITQSWAITRDPLPVYGDPAQIQQVVMNLVLNARDAQPDGGSIRVSLGACELSADQLPADEPRHPGSYLKLEFQDAGVGMSGEVQAKIFEPFFTTKSREQGTGLGLAIVHGIVHDHGGWIDVDSEPNRGSTFRVFLPLDDRPAAQHDLEPREPAVIPRGTQILVIDDDQMVRSLLATSLENAGCTVLQAADGLQGFEVFRENAETIGLVVTDMELPRLTGTESIRRIRAVSSTVPCILITGCAPDAEYLEQLNTLQCETLFKPFQMADLKSTIARLLARPVATQA